jgi:hypothetical protein
MTDQTPAYISKSGMIQTHPGCPNYKVIQNADTPAKQAKVGAMEITQADARKRITSGANKQCGMCAKIEAKVAEGPATVNIPGLGQVSAAGLNALKAAGAELKEVREAQEARAAKKEDAPTATGAQIQPKRQVRARKTPMQKLEEQENAAKAKAAKATPAKATTKPSPRQASAAASQAKVPAKTAPKATATKAPAKKAATPKKTAAPKVPVADKPYKSAFLVNGEVVSMAAARRWAEAVKGETYGAYVPRTVRAEYAAAKAAGYVEPQPKAEAK